MIKQHYYTRERSGLYSSNPGYNTVAKSETLEDSFVKSLLQEYCFYEIPFKLVNETDYNKFPKAYTCFFSPTGDMVLGCNSFIPKDYQGKRSTFFTHNYIIPVSEKDIFIKKPEKMVYSSGFKSNFDIDIGSILAEVETLETDSKEDNFPYLGELLKELNMEETTFKQIIMACFMSVTKNKKIYIILDVDISLISKYAKGLLKYIFKTLPYEVRRNMGYVTYVKDSKSKEYINLEFLPQGALKNIDTEVAAGYVFDFSLRRFLTEGLDIEKHKYLDLILYYIEDEKKLNLYMETADELIVSNKLDIEQQDEFCEFFQGNRNLTAQTYNDFKNDKIITGEMLLQEKILENIEKLEIDKMNIEDLIKIELGKTFVKSENYEVIYIIQQVMSLNSFVELIVTSKLLNNSSYNEKVEKIIKKHFMQGINKESYLILLCVFSKVQIQDLILDLMGTTEFIYENASKEEARKFLVWLCENSINIYEDDIKNLIEKYINLYDNKIFKYKKTRSLFMKASRGQLREFLREEEYKRTKGFRKLFLKWRKITGGE